MAFVLPLLTTKGVDIDTKTKTGVPLENHSSIIL